MARALANLVVLLLAAALALAPRTTAREGDTSSVECPRK